MYPNDITPVTRPIDTVTLVGKASVDDHADHIDAIEEELGVLPKGGYATVAARLASMGEAIVAKADASHTHGASTLEDNSVGSSEIQTDAVGSSEIAESAVGNSEIANAAVNQIKLANSSVGTQQIMDGNVTTEKLDDDAVETVKILDGAVTQAKLADDVYTPVGIFVPYVGDYAPSGWLLCGQDVSRATYSALFDVAGTAYGVGDGSTTFGLPGKGRIYVQRDSGITEFDTKGEVGGYKNVTLTTSQMPSHTHPPGSGNGNAFTVTFRSLQVSTGPNYYAGNGWCARTGSAGSGLAHSNLQPYQVCNYIIKY